MIADVQPIAFVPVEASSPSGNGGVSDDPEPPGVEDAPELSERAAPDDVQQEVVALAGPGEVLARRPT